MSEKLRADLQHIADSIAEGSRVLDLGCSDGSLLYYIEHEKNADGRGIDISQSNVSHCVNNGLSVIQGDADLDLKHYPDKCFDYVIASQILQATKHPKEVLSQMLRISKHVIVSIPNFGHWYNRLYLSINGRMPVSRALSYQWYETPNIHFCTIKDFDILCDELNAKIEDKKYLYDSGKKISSLKRIISANLFSQRAIFVLKG
ncbi:methionine biosynthesis protein MetW [Rickettsiales bacterium]|nr:methionine biosynthesis protein MetW [Rickettsiales bacterium]